MIKHGRVVLGETPSEVSGKPATELYHGMPLAAGDLRSEQARESGSLEKLARATSTQSASQNFESP